MNKVRSNKESMRGKEAGLGFLFLYSLLSGDLKCKILGTSGGLYGGYGGGYGGYGNMDIDSFSLGKSEGSVNDSHRFAVLLAQFYVDKQTKSLPASIVNVLCRNRQVSLRMPKFKDTRKATTNNRSKKPKPDTI